MKKSNFITAILIVFSATQLAFSQGITGVKVGVKGGVNFSNLTSDDNNSNKVLTGVNFGLFAKLPITKSFALQPEVYFITKGSEITYNNVFVDGTGKFELNYIEVPLLAVINLTNNINFQVGPYASYLVSSKVKNVTNVNFNFEDNIDSGDFNKFDTGVIAGFGFDGKSLGFGVRYNLGLITVGKEKNYNGTTYTFPNSKNGVINLYLSYSIL